MDNLTMNRRGDVPTVLIIPVSFVLILLALFSFLTISGKLENSSKDVSQVITEVNFYEGYVRSIANEIFIETINSKDIDLKKKYQEICQKRELQIAEAGNFFGKIRTGDFVLEKKDGKYTFEIKGLFVKSERNANKMTRTFDINLNFDLLNNPDVLNEAQTELKVLSLNNLAYFNINNEEHSLFLEEIETDTITVLLQSEPVRVKLNLGEETEVDLDSDGHYDAKINLTTVDKEKKIAYVSISVEQPGVSSFLSDIRDQRNISFKKMIDEIDVKLSDPGYKGIIIGEFHGIKKQKDFALNFLQILIENKNIFFLEEGYGNSPVGGEIFSEGYVKIRKGNDEEYIQLKEYLEFIDMNNIPHEKIYNQFKSCPDINRKLDSLTSKDILVVYVGSAHINAFRMIGAGIGPPEGVFVESCFAEHKLKTIQIIMVPALYFSNNELEEYAKQGTLILKSLNYPDAYYIITDDFYIR